MDWEKLLSSQTQVEKEKEPEYFSKYPISDLEKTIKQLFPAQPSADCRIRHRYFLWIKAIL